MSLTWEQEHVARDMLRSARIALKVVEGRLARCDGSFEYLRAELIVQQEDLEERIRRLRRVLGEVW